MGQKLHSTPPSVVIVCCQFGPSPTLHVLKLGWCTSLRQLCCEERVNHTAKTSNQTIAWSWTHHAVSMLDNLG